MKQLPWIFLLLLNFSLVNAQRGATVITDTTKSYRTQIANDTCRVFIRSTANDSLVANTWLLRRGQKVWGTTLYKARFKIPFKSFTSRRDDTTSLSDQEVRLGFLSSKEFKAINFDDLVFERFVFDFIRSSRLFYTATFKDSKTKQRYSIMTGILYMDEKTIKKWKKEAIMIFGILKVE